MIIRRVAKAAAVTAAIGASAAIGVLALSGAAGADLVTNQQIPAVVPQAGASAGIPFSSGQQVTVSVPANTILPHSTNIHILECQAGPGGTPPTGTPNCDVLTQYPLTAVVASDGSLTKTDFNVFALPSPALGETASNPTVCGGSSNPCILYIGADQTQPSLPHVWSQAFQVVKKDAGELGTNPGDGTPEVPLAIGLPLAAAGLVGGTVLLRRRKAARTAA